MEYITSRVGSGTFVCKHTPEKTLEAALSDKRMIHKECEQGVPTKLPSTKKKVQPSKNTQKELAIDFQLERTNPHSFPAKTWRRLINNRLTTVGDNMTKYGDPQGLESLRESIATRLAVTRGVVVDPSQVLILTGIQQGLNIISQLFIKKGSKVVCEAPGYSGAELLFQSCGAKVIPVPVGVDGIDTEELKKHQASFAVITPSRQYPMGTIMPVKNRINVIDWAATSGSYVVEIDYDSDFHYEGTPLPAVKALDEHECVFYLSSFSKTIGPGLRLGYMVLPAAFVDKAKGCKKLLDYGLPWLDQAVLADFIHSGSYDIYLKRLRKMYSSRRDCLMNELATHLGEVDLRGPECGTHLIWKLPEYSPDVDALQEALLRHKVGIYSLRHSSICNWQFEKENNRLMLLGYGALSKSKIITGIQRIIQEIG
jgi:GntR family transcriptional regulator/MocR family aminotransferase